MRRVELTAALGNTTVFRPARVYTVSFSAPTMFLWCVLSIFLLCALTDIHADTDCPSLPVFSPSVLVVKYGGPAFTTCSICNDSCQYDLRLEEPLGSSFRSGSEVIWNVTHLRLWRIRPICYIFDSSCQEYLDVTVYQPPDRVSLSFGESSGPLVEGRLYSLQCEVEAVAPAQNMTVAFYRGHRELGLRSSRTQQKSPVNETLSLDYRVSRQDHGAHFWCEVRLELGPRGPQPPPVVRSQNLTANVHFAPYSGASAETQLLTVYQGQSAELDCSSVGNPSPHYSWTVPSDKHTLFSGSVFIVHSASSQHEGLYSCNVSNPLGSLRRSFTLTLHDLPMTVTVTPVNKSAEAWRLQFLSVCISFCLSLCCHLVTVL